MGITYARMRIRKIWEATERADVDFMVDSGAMHSLLPEKIPDSLGIAPHRRLEFRLADGTAISRQAGDAFSELNHEGAVAPVIFGGEGDEPLPGTTAPEALGIVLNPFTRTLHPMRMLTI